MVTLLLSVIFSVSAFEDTQCIRGNFDLHLRHPGPLFGLIGGSLRSKKDQCHLNVSYSRFSASSWEVDLCRSPIHIKQNGVFGVDVFKRKSACQDSGDSKFCKATAEMKRLIQDIGLIFAVGNRQDLTTPHGQAYCTGLLLDYYLGEGRVFSMQDISFRTPKIVQKEVRPVDVKTPSMPSKEPAPPTSVDDRPRL